MNAIEEIALTHPKENAGPGTSLRFEYQMNWGLSKLLDMEENDEDYVIAFDYHDDIIIFNKEEDATAVDFYQVKTKKNGEWRLKEIYKPLKEEDETEFMPNTENEESEQDETGKGNDNNQTKENKTKLSYLTKLLSHSLLISSARNYYFVTNRQFKKAGFTKSPTGKKLSFEDIEPLKQEEIVKAVSKENQNIDVEHHIKNFYILQDQIPLDKFKLYLKGAVNDFLKTKAPAAEIDADVFYETLLNRIVRTRNNYDDDISDAQQFLEKKCFSKSKFSELISRLANLESFNSRVGKITTWLTNSQILPYEEDEIQNQLKEIRKDMSLYGNMSLSRLLNKIKDVIASHKMEKTDTTYLIYAKKIVDILKSEMKEASNYSEDYLKALVLYEKAK